MHPTSFSRLKLISTNFDRQFTNSTELATYTEIALDSCLVSIQTRLLRCSGHQTVVSLDDSLVYFYNQQMTYCENCHSDMDILYFPLSVASKNTVSTKFDRQLIEIVIYTEIALIFDSVKSVTLLKLIICFCSSLIYQILCRWCSLLQILFWMKSAILNSRS